MFIYENHMGGFMLSDEPIPFEDSYCATCGDCDIEIGFAETKDEALKILKDWQYDAAYIQAFLEENWGFSGKER